MWSSFEYIDVMTIQSLRTFIFDVDHNLSTLDRIVFLEKDGEIFECPSKIMTQKLSEWYIWLHNSPLESTIHFRDDGEHGIETFPMFIRETCEKEEFWPSFPKFKEAILYAEPFAINTARAHASTSLSRGIEILIDTMLDDEEKKIMLSHLGRRTTETTFPEALHAYISQQYFIAVSSPEFLDLHRLIDGEIPSAHRKALALPAIIEHFLEIRGSLFHMQQPMSIGFSDDEKPNIDAIMHRWDEHKDFLQEHHIHFVCYDTSSDPHKMRVTEKE
jgi:hypothetical protein